jgi:hypothetical protein
VAPGVPAERCNAIAEFDAVTLEPLRDFQRACANVPVIGAVDRTLDRARDDLAIAMDGRAMIDHAAAQQRPVLHQTTHRKILLLGRAPG